MSERVFHSEQVVPLPRPEAFAFFVRPENLEALTPSWLRFRLVSSTTAQVESGTVLTYRLRIRCVPVTWVSRITDWEPGRRFVDEQLRGPYAAWRHTHTFEDDVAGTRIGDHVEYRLPLGRLGDLVAGPFVRRDVRNIFRFRNQRIGELLGTVGVTKA